MKEQYLFVYGTLRRNSINRFHPLLARQATYVDEASLQGRLFRIGHYPGLIFSANPRHQVKGEVYILNHPTLTLPRLDRYEECGPGFTEPTEYLREKKEVLLYNGKKVLAWVYIFQRPTDRLEEISSGDFLRPDRT